MKCKVLPPDHVRRVLLSLLKDRSPACWQYSGINMYPTNLFLVLLRRSTAGFLVILCGLVGTDLLAKSAWTQEYGAPTSLVLTALACRQDPGFRTWVAAGEGGTLIVSSNLVDRPDRRWHAVDLGTEAWIRDLSASSNSFLAVGDSGTLFLGSPPLEWRSLDYHTNVNWVGVARGSNQWVAVSDRGSLIAVTDAGDVIPLPSIRSSRKHFFTSLRSSDAMFVATGIMGALFTSSNLVDWVDRSLPTSEPLSRARFGSRRWCVAAGGRIFTSPDGNEWMEMDTGVPTRIHDLAHRPASSANPPTWIGVGDNGATYVTTNMARWYPIRSDYLTSDLLAIEVCRGHWATVGTRGTFWSAVLTPGQPEPDGTRTRWWVNHANPLVNALPAALPQAHAIAFSGKTLIGIGKPGRSVVQSPTNSDVSIETTGITSFISHLEWTGEGWLAVGDEGGVYHATKPSQLWRPIPSNIGRTSDTNSFVNTSSGLRSLHRHGPLWITVGDEGTIRGSTNGGNSWFGVPSPTTEHLLSVRYGNGRWVAVGGYQVILGSPDGLTWTQLNTGSHGAEQQRSPAALSASRWKPSSPETDPAGTNQWNPIVRFTLDANAPNFNAVDWCQCLWVAVGDEGTVVTSPNGIDWGPPVKLCSESFKAVRGSAEGWLIVGENGTAWTSPDGNSWTRTSTKTHLTLTSIDLMDESWVVGGVGWTTLSLPRAREDSPRTEMRLDAWLEWNVQSNRYDYILQWPSFPQTVSLKVARSIQGPFSPVTAEPHCTGRFYELRLPVQPGLPALFTLSNP